jgi:hypothetical protein
VPRACGPEQQPPAHSSTPCIAAFPSTRSASLTKLVDLVTQWTQLFSVDNSRHLVFSLTWHGSFFLKWFETLNQLVYSLANYGFIIMGFWSF